MRLGIVASHPVQYQVPWYRALAAREEIDLTVYYPLLPSPEQQGVGFGETGHVFPFGDTRALASILIRLEADPKARRRMGGYAARHISSFSQERAVEGTLSTLRWVLERAPVTRAIW